MRMSPKLLAVPLLFLGCSSGVLFLRSESFYTANPAIRYSVRPNVSAAPTPSIDSGRNQCPAENELQTKRHFRLWDEKLEQALRRSGQDPPKMEEESWNAVTDDIHIFTAFVATTTEHAIHITALVRSQKANANLTFTQRPHLVCIIRKSNRIILRKARIRRVWFWFNPTFWNALILCRPPKERRRANEDIRVAVTVRGMGQDSLRWLRLHRLPETIEEKCCAVCVRPVYGSSMSLWKLVEFVTHYRIHGVNRFYFYDLDMSSGLKLLLARMQSAGVNVTLVPFKLIASTEDVHSHGQMPALYDCIFRSMAKTEYYIHVDIDEFIVPVRHGSIPSMVQEQERKSILMLGSLVIPNRHFCSEYPLNVRFAAHEYVPLQTRLFTRHNADMNHRGVSKYIARSRSVCDASIHSIVKHCGEYREVNLDSSVAFFKHYRRCCEIPSELQKLIRLWDMRDIAVDHSALRLSTRIERDAFVRSLRHLVR